jgi:predicted nucleic acid-binding protein
VILLDTSALIESLAGQRLAFSGLTRLLERGEMVGLCTIVLYEWLRGPRLPGELATQEALFPSDAALPFETADARISAELYRSVSRARAREADIAIAACAIRRDAELWTINRADFADIPRLRLARP